MKSIKKRTSFLQQRKETINAYPHMAHELVNRRTGKTLSIALHVISTAMINRNRAVKVVSDFPRNSLEVADHTPGEYGAKFLINMVADLISKLELEGFIVDKKLRTITYKLETVRVK